MRARVLLMALLVLLPTTIGAAETRDLAAEVMGGANVRLYVEYSGDVSGSRSGEFQGPNHRQTLAESITNHVEWEAGFTLLHSPHQGETRTAPVLGEWESSGSYSRESEIFYADGHSSGTRRCTGGGYKAPLMLNAEVTPQLDGLRLRLSGVATWSMEVAEACHWTQQADGSSDSGTDAMQMPVTILHALQSQAADAEVTVIVPYSGVASFPLSFTAPITSEGPAGMYCSGALGTEDWADGTCTATGRLKVRAFVDPCGYITEQYDDHYAALAAISPPPAGADEQAVRAWAAPHATKIALVLNDHRNWQMFGCYGDLQPDPWDALERVSTMLRDALVAIAKRGELSPEGMQELVAAERSRQMLGGPEDDFTLADIPGIAQAAAPRGTMQVSVHSPVSLHVWDEHGGHVGWNAATNANESTIAGATYAGAPGGAQTITLPAGFYKIVADEIDHGLYLLNVSTQETGADTNDTHLITSMAGRTTSTHYAVKNGWNGPELHVFPVRRGETPSMQNFVDDGRPVTGFTYGSAGAGTTQEGGAASAPAKGIPSPALAVMLVMLGAAAWVRRR